MKSDFAQGYWVDWAFSDDIETEASRTAFWDLNDSLGLDGSAIQQRSPLTWRLSLDDANS